MGRACSTHGEKRNEYVVFVGTPEGKTPLGIPDIGEKIIFKWILNK
jgi:hypothetical protein